jgi:hypothetical protein
MAHTYFVMKLPPEADKVLVWDTRTLTVGRAPENALVLQDPDVSRRHAIFTKDGDRYDVGDHLTGNGTFVNGEGVTGTRPIHPGDVVTIGKLQLELCISDEHPAKCGMKLEYASHLMTGGMVPEGGDPSSTMVGIGDSSANDDPFVIEHNDGTGSDLFGGDVLDLDLLASAPAPFKDLDADMGGTEATVPPAAQPAPPAEDPNDSQTDPIGRMRRLKSLHAEGLITDDEFQQKRAQILKDV